MDTHQSYSRTRLRANTPNSGSPTRILKSPSKYSYSPTKFTNSPRKRSMSPSKYSNASTTSSTKTIHRLKLELEVCTEQMKRQKYGVSMTCLVKWNIEKVVEKHPSVNLELEHQMMGRTVIELGLQKAIHDCQKKLDVEPSTGQYCLPQSLASPVSDEDRHISCALLAWQAKGETDLDKLVDLAENIRKATKLENETNFGDRVQIARQPSPPKHFLTYPPNQLSRDQPDSQEFDKKGFNLNVTEAFHLKKSRRAGSPCLLRKPSPKRSWHERKVTKTCATSNQCCGNNADIMGPVATKQFYEGLAGPVIKLPDSCPCDFKEFPPECLVTKVPQVYKAEKDGQGENQQLDIPVCLEGKCVERLRQLDKAVGALRQRAARLAKRDQERKQILERAEKAWQEMERGFQKQLILAEENEEEIAERITNLVNDRNGYKNSCLCGETDLEDQNQLLQAAEANLSQLISAIKQKEKEKQQLEREWIKLGSDIDKEKMLAHNKQKELTFTEERLRTRLTSLSEDLDVQQKLTEEMNRALVKELESLKEQFNVVSKQLLQADDQNTTLKAKLAQIKETKAEMMATLDRCKVRCDNIYVSVKKELEEKNKELDQKKEEAFACSCKLPVDTSCQVKRTPSFVAACRCTKPHSGKSCSCTSLKTRMMKDLVKDIFEGMRDEIAEGTAMPCELLKCMEDDFDWNAGTPLKQKIRDFFEELMHNELDIAIVTAIEQYHARWTNDSCVDKGRASKKESNVIVMRVEKTESFHLPTMTSQPPPLPCDLSLSTTDKESPWEKTQTDVFHLSLEMKQLKRKSIRRRDLQTMEQNLAKIVQNVVKPQRRSKVEKATAMTPRSTDIFRPTSMYRTAYVPKSHERSQERSSSKVTKEVAANPKINSTTTKFSLLKGRASRNQKKVAQKHVYAPDLNSTDLCLSPEDYTVQRQKGTTFSSLLKNLYLNANVVAQAEVKEHGTANTPSISKKKPSAPPVYKNEFYESGYQRIAPCDNVQEVITKATFAHQFSPEVFTLQNTSSYRDERKEKKARRETYNRLISDCMQSFTRGQISLKSKENALDDESLYEDEHEIKPDRHFKGTVSEISVLNGTGSFASWKTAQDEDISSLIESVHYSKTCIANKKVQLTHICKSSTKTPTPYSAGTKGSIILNQNDVKGNIVNMNTAYVDNDKSSIGVYFINKLCSSITSLLSCNKNKSECSCNPENIGAHINRIREDKSKQTEKSKLKSKLRFKHTNKKSRISSTSLKSKTSLASSTKSKYHKWCTLDSSARDAHEKKTKLKKKSAICKPCDKSKTKFSMKQSNKVEQAGVQTCSDVCNKACQCDIGNKTQFSKSSSMDDEIKTDTNIEKGVKACLCEFKSIGAGLLRDKNAARVYGGDRFGIGPFRGIFGPDQQPLGQAQKFPLECEGEAGTSGGKAAGQAGALQAVTGPRFSDADGKQNPPEDVTESGIASGRGSSGDGVETLTTTEVDPSSELRGSESNAVGCKITGESNISSHPGDAKCKSKCQSTSKRESFICEDQLSPKMSLGIGLHKCLCAGSIASAQVQTSKQYLSSDDNDDDEECVCCSKSDKQKSKDLETNAFQLLQQYILSKIKKMKCECCPFLNPDIDENIMYMNLLKKIQGVISKDIGRLACRCRERDDIESSEYMAFSLLEEYIKNKLEEMMCSCNGTHADVSPDFYTDVLDTIKKVIEEDLADIKCCCHTMINECPCNIEKKDSGLLNQKSMSDKMCETCFYDQTTQISDNEVKKESSTCIEGIKKIIRSISEINLSSDRQNSESKKDSSGNQTSSKSVTGGRNSKSADDNEVESIWCKCLPDRYSSNVSSELVTSSTNLTSSKQSLTGKQNGQYIKKRTSSSNRQSSPDLTSGSRKNSVTFNRQDSVRKQSGAAMISGRRVVSSESCDICKMNSRNVCPLCKTVLSPDNQSEVRDLLSPSQGKKPCGCDLNMKSCTCENINQRQESNAMNIQYRPNSYGQNGYRMSATNIHQPNVIMNSSAPNKHGLIDVNTVPQYEPNTYPAPENASASYTVGEANNGHPVPEEAYVIMDPCRCRKKFEKLNETAGADGAFAGRGGAKGRFVSSGRGGVTNDSRVGSTNGARNSKTSGANGGVNQVKPSPKCCSNCKKKAERANKSNKPTKMQCDCSAKL